jgi:hypothetical protein
MIFKQNELLWHKDFFLENIARKRIVHKTFDEALSVTQRFRVKDPYSNEAIDVRTAHVLAKSKRTRTGEYKCRSTYNGSQAYFYIDDLAFKPYIADPRFWSRKQIDPSKLTVKTVHSYFRTPARRPIVQWCWRCQMFFMLGDSFLCVGSHNSDQPSGYRHEGCTFYVCPYCHACDPVHTPTRLHLTTVIRFPVKGQPLRQFKTKVVKLRDLQQEAIDHTERYPYQALFDENIDIPQWQQDILLGKEVQLL